MAEVTQPGLYHTAGADASEGHRLRRQDRHGAADEPRGAGEDQQGQATYPNVWFVGVTPRRNPELVVAVLWQNGEFSYYPARIGARVVAAYVDKKRRLAGNLPPEKAAAPVEVGAVWTARRQSRAGAKNSASADRYAAGISLSMAMGSCGGKRSADKPAAEACSEARPGDVARPRSRGQSPAATGRGDCRSAEEISSHADAPFPQLSRLRLGAAGPGAAAVRVSVLEVYSATVHTGLPASEPSRSFYRRGPGRHVYPGQDRLPPPARLVALGLRHFCCLAGRGEGSSATRRWAHGAGSPRTRCSFSLRSGSSWC